MLRFRELSGAAALVVGTFAVSPALAHFKLIKPTSWLNEDPGSGAPQKGGPCGPGGSDNISPTPASGAITTFHAGETITLTWIDTIAHPGHFRIALAENRDDLKDPDIKQDAFCGYDEKAVPTGAHGNVLADGVFFRPASGTYTAGMTFTTQVTLPDAPCEKCTLQVLQVMESDIQAISNCHYYHCADIKILAANDPAADSPDDAGAPVARDAASTDQGSSAPGDQPGSGERVDAGTQPGTGTSTGGTTTTKKDASAGNKSDAASDAEPSTGGGDSGCSMLAGHAVSLEGASWMLALLGVLVGRLRKSKQA
ncbi:MAG: hypothetical protein JWN04_1376 [Myxococcaceae bacterium]|nr:hypothetical protein [Myxococcaceae bacterium]